MKSYGVIKMYNDEKGFGFIRLDAAPDERPREIFFHISDFHSVSLQPPKKDMRVEFEISESRDKNGENKPRARLVTSEENPVDLEPMEIASPPPRSSGASRY